MESNGGLTEAWGPIVKYIERSLDIPRKLFSAFLAQQRAYLAYRYSIVKYLSEFMDPYFIAQNAFVKTERRKLLEAPPWESFRDYFELFQFNMQVAQKGYKATADSMTKYHMKRNIEALESWLATVLDGDGDIRDLASFWQDEARLVETVIYEYPKAIWNIKPEYGFHFERGGFVKTGETERFLLYQVLPQDRGIEVKKDGKPVVIIHPYVLGPNIICFLPGEKKSFVHAYANQGVPTYVRIMKDIAETPAVQTMSGEDDAEDTRLFCETLYRKHGKQVTLNGFCQGGFIAMVELLSGVLDGLVDAIITCVSPMDGTRSKSLVEYLEHLPPRFRDLGYAVKTLPSGNRVVDGKVMSWVYKLKSMEKEAPLHSIYRDIAMFDRPSNKEIKISKTAAAINHWLIYDRDDLPEAITKMSFDSYTIPVDREGNLPVKLYGRKLNFKRLGEKGMKLLVCYAETDDLVDKETAIAPLDFVEGEMTEFPKGHGAIATSWSHPDSECALHKTFRGGRRGPVRFHLDLDK